MTLDHLTKKYSERLGVITAEQLQAALERFNLGQLHDAEPAPGGNFGQNVLLTSSEGQFVLRGKPHYPWQFAKESFFAYLIRERTEVIAPWPYLIDESTDIFGWQYALMPRLPGYQLGNESVRASFSEADRIAIAQAMGRGLALLHELKWPFCADSDENGKLTQIKSSYRDWITGIAEGRIAKSRVASTDMTDADEAWCRELLAQNAAGLEVPFQPAIVHHDYKEGNVVVQPAGHGWEVSGVFDLMECYFGDPEEDLVRSILDYETEQPGSPLPAAFVQAYAGLSPLRPGFRQRFIIHMLRDCLLVWAFGQRQGWFAPGGEQGPGSFRSFAERLVTLDPYPSQ